VGDAEVEEAEGDKDAGEEDRAKVLEVVLHCTIVASLDEGHIVLQGREEFGDGFNSNPDLLPLAPSPLHLHSELIFIEHVLVSYQDVFPHLLLVIQLPVSVHVILLGPAIIIKLLVGLLCSKNKFECNWSICLEL
jgi:hypothetical protein